MLSYLLDEHVSPAYRRQLLRRAPELTVYAIGDSGAPPKRTPDPDLLRWCEKQDFVLVTNDRASMQPHLNDHLAEGRHVPGIFILNANMSFGATVEELLLLAIAAFEGEFSGRLTFLPYSH